MPDFARLRAKRLFLLDLDGTLYLDERLFDGAADFLRAIRSCGGTYRFLTNNSSRGAESYVEKLRRLGVEAETSDFLTSVDALGVLLDELEVVGEVALVYRDELIALGIHEIIKIDNSSRGAESYVEKLRRLGVEAETSDFLTSVDALIAHLHAQGMAEKLLYVCGTQSMKRQLTQAGLRLTDDRDAAVDALVMGFDTELTFQKLEDACILLNRGADYLDAVGELGKGVARTGRDDEDIGQVLRTERLGLHDGADGGTPRRALHTRDEIVGQPEAGVVPRRVFGENGDQLEALGHFLKEHHNFWVIAE